MNSGPSPSLRCCRPAGRVGRSDEAVIQLKKMLDDQLRVLGPGAMSEGMNILTGMA